MPIGVLMRHDFMCGLSQIIKRMMQAIHNRQLLKMQPEPFDYIQEQTIGGCISS